MGYLQTFSFVILVFFVYKTAPFAEQLSLRSLFIYAQQHVHKHVLDILYMHPLPFQGILRCN